MHSTVSRPKKAPSSKARKAGRVPVRLGPPRTASSPARGAARTGLSHPASLRSEFRVWRDSLPTKLERDTLLMPDAIAESVVQEAERYLKAQIPEDFATRLAAKAHYLYPRHKHFHKGLNSPGNRGRENLRMFMRHWTAGWLKRERYALYKKLPRSFGMGAAAD